MSFLGNIEKFVPDLKQRKILDLGCGRGDDLIELAQNGYDAVGLDISTEYLDSTAKRAKDLGLVVKLIKAEGENLPLMDQSFDFIVCSEVTEHVESPEEILKECYRVLKPGGKAYVSFHNRFGPYDHHYHMWFINWLPRNFADKVIDIIGKTKSADEKAGRQKLSAMHYFTYGRVVRSAKQCGFECFDMREAQIRNPALSSRRILKIIAKSGMSALAVYAMKKFIGTFHFILEKR